MSFNNTKTPLKPTAKAKWQIPTRKKKGGMEFYLEGTLKKKFCRLYPVNTNPRLMEWFGISFSTLQRFRRELGLKKDMKAIHLQHAADIKATCEVNGYYASIRGKRPSEAAIEAIRKKFAEGFNPLTRLKEINPEKYGQVMKARSEQRKEMFRMERMRMDYGLKRKTKLRIPMYPLGKGAYQQKSLLIKKHNYFPDPLGDPHVVCYDSQTERSERMESTAIRHGLQIVKAED